MLYLLDLLGIFAFAITGAYKAKGAKLNILGAIFLGVITAIGGGTFRDVIINRVPLFYLKDPNYFLVAILGSIIVYFVPALFKRAYSLFRFIDSLGLASFVVIGVSISFSSFFRIQNGPTLVSFFTTIFLGMITGFGGGIIRDSIMGEIPFSFRKGSNYATSAFWGAFSFYFLMFVNFELAVGMSIIVTIVFREVISKYGIYKRIKKSHS